MAINNAINSGQLLNTSATPQFVGLVLSSTGGNIALNNLTTAQFTAQSPSQGSAAFSNSAETIIFFDGMGNQLVATQSYVVGTFAPIITYTEITGTVALMVANNEYTANNASLVTLTLPATAAIGTTIFVNGKGAGGWKIAQNASQLIHFGTSVTTTGTGGNLSSTNQWDNVKIKCITADTTWVVQSVIGNLTVV